MVSPLQWWVMIRVVVAEDSLLVREGLVQLLMASPDIEVVAACEDSDGVMSAIGAHAVDVILTDIRMPPSGTPRRFAARILRLASW